MQYLFEQSEVCKEIGLDGITEEIVGMTVEIADDLKKIAHRNLKFLNNDIDVLCFVHKWRMTKSYDIMRDYVRDGILSEKYDIDSLKKICGDIFSDMFKTVEDMDKIATVGDLYVFQKAHENGCEWDKWTSMTLAENGHLDCLRYAHNNGCPWNEMTCAVAAEHGRLNCLKYAYENGCPWNDLVFKLASRWRHIECIRYAYDYMR